MKKRIISLLLVAVLLFGIAPQRTFAQETEPQQPDCAQVSISAQSSGAFLCGLQENVTVRADLAESYGYTDKAGGVTTLDVLVKAHEIVFGDAFTKADCQTYLSVAASGWVTTAFGDNGAAFTFTVNGAQPNDGVLNSYGSYTGYLITEAAVQSGDAVSFMFYQDATYYLDNYAWFTQNDTAITELCATPGASVSLGLQGYCICYYGCSPEETIQETTEAIADAQLAWVDANGAIKDITGAVSGEDGNVTVTMPDATGDYLLTAYITQEDIQEYYATPMFLPLLRVRVMAAPTAITVQCGDGLVLDGKYIVASGDRLQFTAVDQNGDPTPVTWSTKATIGTLDAQTGEFVIESRMTPGSTSYVYITATSTLDASVKVTSPSFSMTGYQFGKSEYSVALSDDGQTEKIIRLSGGASGHSVWSYDTEAAAGVAVLTDDPGNGTSMNFRALRPGSFPVSVALDVDSSKTDTATVTVTGVAVEDADGNQKKTYLRVSSDNPNPTARLGAYCEPGKYVTAWSSSDEAIVSVDASGKITAHAIGSAIVFAEDNAGAKGGIRVVVSSQDTPYFESMEFMTSALVSGSWTTGSTFSPTKLEYDLPIRTYSTSKLTLQATTAYDTEKYDATAHYTDLNGEAKDVPVNSGKITYLEDIPFDASTLTITLASKADPENSTCYTFHITRPRDTSKKLHSNGNALVPDGRDLLTAKYNGKAEGTMFRADETGAAGTSTGTTAKHYHYRTYLLEGTAAFRLTFNTTTKYTHLRYSLDDGASWTEMESAGKATTDRISFPAGQSVVKVVLEVLDDETYAANLKNGKDGFAEGEPVRYTFWVEQVQASADSAQLTTATTEQGEWYPAFSPDLYSYNIVVPNKTTEGTLVFTVSEGATVALGKTALTPDENGSYTVALKTSNQTLTVTSADGTISNSYTVKLLAKSKYDVPDRVVDYLCIGSQYTNGSYGIQPEVTLNGSMKSLGNFGGYITYYYENPLVNNPLNPYGVDFYVYGNAFDDGGSAAEPGQVYVSEDNVTWYALAGSEHYEDTAIWNYTITYTKDADGNAVWTDNQGNTIGNTPRPWPKASAYYLNFVPALSTYTFAGVLLKSSLDNTVMGDSTTGSLSAVTSFGYADYYANGTIGAAVNPYNADTKNNGFDLAWAVDASGNPVDVSGKEFHYVKIATASNIWAGAFNEKSTEVSYVVRATPADAAVGKTDAPSGVTITCGNASKSVCFQEGQQIYSVDVGDMKYLSLHVDGAAAEDNIYVNNRKITSDASATGIQVTKESGEVLVRIIVQNGEKEPAIYLLKLTGNAPAGNELISGITAIGANTTFTADCADGEHYTLTVPNRVQALNLYAELAVSGAAVTISDAEGNPVTGETPLEVGETAFTVTATLGELSQTVSVSITRTPAPTPSEEKITVSFALYGDALHGSDFSGEHTWADQNLEVWIPATEYTVPADATVLDVFELALTAAGYSWNNAGGNYIDTINGLAAMDNGTSSGWMYLLNGAYPSLGLAEQHLKKDDIIIFHYTDNYNREFSAISDADAAAAAEALINAIVTPVTLESQPSIQAAREAYNALTDPQKALVGNYSVLLDAEAQLARLLKDANVFDIYETTGDYLEETSKLFPPTFSDIGGEWLVFGLLRSGRTEPAGYYKNVVAYVRENIDSLGRLHRSRSTDNSRAILALTAGGHDVTNIGGHNLLLGLSDMDYVLTQGVNGPIWALIALDSHDYEIPAAPEGAAQVTREKLIAAILDAQLPDGGWAIDGSTADPDTTAMALTALARYSKETEAVQSAIDAALARLSAMQQDDGGYVSMGASNSESCAQVVVALCALGIDPAEDSRFVKNGHSVLDALCAYYVEGGGFRHLLTGERNGMATEQGYYALAAYVRASGKLSALFDLREVEITAGPVDPDNPHTGDPFEPVLLGALLLVCLCSITVLLPRRKRF